MVLVISFSLLSNYLKCKGDDCPFGKTLERFMCILHLYSIMLLCFLSFNIILYIVLLTSEFSNEEYKAAKVDPIAQFSKPVTVGINI